MSPSTKYTTHIVCVGAVYIDTILTVPHFPIEDEKLRAKKLSKRRGGNTANSLEVLTQVVNHSSTLPRSTRLHLISVLPDEASDATKFISDSLPDVHLVDSCIFRDGYAEAASSYIIQNELNLSRTIVSINELPEMTAGEFRRKVDRLPFIGECEGSTKVWIHFEGRIPEVLLECVKYLRSLLVGSDLKISVECEKPERTLMAEVARYADVVFYSKIWAEACQLYDQKRLHNLTCLQKNGYDTAENYLKSQLASAREGALLCCTWGSSGATVVQKSTNPPIEHAHSEEWATSTSWHPPDSNAVPNDSIGAGDTFVAGMLFALTSHGDWTLQRKLQYANELAGRKVFQSGFSGLGKQMLET